MKRKLVSFVLLLVLAFSFKLNAQENKEPELKDVSLSGLKFRSIGPAITGGRISSIAVNPNNFNEYYVASGHGNLWKTTNRGITFKPVFDNQNSYSIGYVTIDPNNTNVVWVGTGENNNQNNVIYGDGIYKSEDGGKSWKNMGLKESEHIGGIEVDPNNSNIVYVAAYGSLRNPGGDRGIFKTVDGGKTWERVLFVSENTGCFQVHMDPRYSNILYAVTHQRMRNLYTGIYGGPESGIYRTTNSGANWEKLKSGLPSEDIGRVGMDISPVNPDILYAVVEADKKNLGFYRSTDRGVSWTKQSNYNSAYKFYFQKIVADTKDADRVYSMDVFMKFTENGGKSFSNVGSKFKHVDDHCMWVNPVDNKHLIAGCDGGVYESYDQGKNWDFKANLPITEIYKVATDNAKPFYNIVFGTQDNNSLTGPSRTISSGGITNNDWLFTNGGDGFESQVDWKDPNIIYALSQNGGLVRFDKKSGENYYIKPYELGDTAYRFDWDAALLISKHDNKRLYFGSQKLLRTDDQGSTWREVSGDLTRGVPKEMQKLMGQSWSIDQLARKSSMANIVTIAESPIDEQVLFVGSGDGLIHYSTNSGDTWQKGNVPDIPRFARIHHIYASNFDKNVAYAAIHDFVGGSKLPYLYKTTDGGENWYSINANLPKRGSTYCVAEDHVDKNLLFAGTQFGVYFSNNGGKEWIKLKNGIPNHVVMDLEIQKDENDLVVSTFGRGVFILDDYSPLRNLSKETLNKEAEIFPIEDALMFIPSNPFGFKGTGFMGASFYSAPNPKIGAVFTYYLKDGFKSLKEKRREAEKELVKKGKDIKHPDYKTLRAEENYQDAYLLFTITDMQGTVIRKIKTGASKGINRIVWNFRTNAITPISLTPFDDSVPWVTEELGYMVVPGKYKVSLSKFVDGKFTEIVSPKEFVCKPLNNTTLPANDKIKLDKFNKNVAELGRAINAANAYRNELVKKISYLKKAVFETANVAEETYNEISSIELELKQLNRDLNGDNLRARYEGNSPISVSGRLSLITYALWGTTGAATSTLTRAYDEAAGRFENILVDLKNIDTSINKVEQKLEQSGAPYTPGRIPVWNNK